MELLESGLKFKDADDHGKRRTQSWQNWLIPAEAGFMANWLLKKVCLKNFRNF